MKVEIGKSYLRNIPHQGGTIDFEYRPFIGTWGDVAGEIAQEGLIRPTFAQSISLIYDAFQNRNGKDESKIIQILSGEGLWGNIGNLYLPYSNDKYNGGVIIEDNPTISNGRLLMDKKYLFKRLDDGDPRIRFVSFGFKTGKQTRKEWEKNSYVRAISGGKEGAQKTAEIAFKLNSDPFLFVYSSINFEDAAYSIIRTDESYTKEGRKMNDHLTISSTYFWSNYKQGCALGVVPKTG